MPTSPGFFIFAAVIWLVVALITGAIASGRGRDGAVWMSAALVLGPILILPLLIFGRPGAD